MSGTIFHITVERNFILVMTSYIVIAIHTIFSLKVIIIIHTYKYKIIFTLPVTSFCHNNFTNIFTCYIIIKKPRVLNSQ